MGGVDSAIWQAVVCDAAVCDCITTVESTHRCDGTGGAGDFRAVGATSRSRMSLLCRCRDEVVDSSLRLVDFVMWFIDSSDYAG